MNLLHLFFNDAKTALGGLQIVKDAAYCWRAAGAFAQCRCRTRRQILRGFETLFVLGSLAAIDVMLMCFSVHYENQETLIAFVWCSAFTILAMAGLMLCWKIKSDETKPE